MGLVLNDGQGTDVYIAEGLANADEFVVLGEFFEFGEGGGSADGVKGIADEAEFGRGGYVGIEVVGMEIHHEVGLVFVDVFHEEIGQYTEVTAAAVCEFNKGKIFGREG